MKGSSLIIAIIALLAVAVLYVLHFSGTNNLDIEASGSPDSTPGTSDLKIAYVKADSIILNYKLAQDLQADFTKKQEAYNSEFGTKRQSFERDAAAFQEKLQRGGFLSEQRAIQERDRLVGMEQEIMQLDQELSGKLAQLQSANNKIIIDSLMNYLNEYNENKKYDLIFNGAEILVGDQTFNITDVVLKALNERYAENSN